MMAYRSLSLIRRALAGVFLVVSLALSGAAYAQQVAIDGPSLEETIAYINSHSKMTFSLSSDGNDLLFQRDVSPCGKNKKLTCGSYYKLPIRWASEVEVKTNGSGVAFQCGVLDRIEETEITPVNLGKESATYFHYRGTLWFADFDDREMGDRMCRAAKHLLALLAERFESDKQNRRGDNDPFK
jgi:hypothetical protein